MQHGKELLMASEEMEGVGRKDLPRRHGRFYGRDWTGESCRLKTVDLKRTLSKQMKNERDGAIAMLDTQRRTTS